MPPPEQADPQVDTETDKDLRARILRVSVRLFADRGFGPTSMREVALAAGCTKPALYYHFGSKEALFRATVEQCLDGLLPLVAQASATKGSVRDRILALAQGVFTATHSDPESMRMMLVMQTRPDKGQPDIDFARYHERNQALILRLFAEGIATGEVREDVNLEDAVLALLGALHSRAFLALKGLASSEDSPARIVDLLFRGLAPASPPRNLP